MFRSQSFARNDIEPAEGPSAWLWYAYVRNCDDRLGFRHFPSDFSSDHSIFGLEKELLRLQPTVLQGLEEEKYRY